MPEGVEVEVGEGFAWLTPLSGADRSAMLGQLLAASEGDPSLIEVDTSGTHRTYIVPESIAQEAGYVDKPKPKSKRKTKAEKESEESEDE